MGKDIRFVGLDVHAESIAVAVAEPGGDVRAVGVIPNRPDAVRRVMRRLGRPERLRVCYEAGPCGYVLYWQLTGMGIACDVVAPTLVPVRVGERVKTDRRDAAKLARSYRSGDLTPVWVPDEAHEALRDLLRARQAAKRDQTRARHRLGKFLLRHGRRRPEGVRSWTLRYFAWLKGVRFDQLAQEETLRDYVAEVHHTRERVERLDRAIDVAVQEAPESMRAVIGALQALRGVAKVTAASVVAEVGPMSRFARPKLLMGYAGIVPREHSSGGRTSRGGITKTGNAHVRHLLVEAALSYRHKPAVWSELQRRQEGLSEEVKALAWRAQQRLHWRFRRLVRRGKATQQAVTAIARELVGFMWAIGVHVEREMRLFEPTRRAPAA